MKYFAKLSNNKMLIAIEQMKQQLSEKIRLLNILLSWYNSYYADPLLSTAKTELMSYPEVTKTI